MEELAENIWLLSYPLKLLGIDFRRHVTVIRLGGGDLVIHSTGPFSPNDVAEIRRRGRPRWILDAMLDHDTFAEAGRRAFPEAQFLGPDGFGKRTGVSCQALIPPPPEWEEELKVLAVRGAPDFSEHVFLHRPSRTLIVADLVFNLERSASLWERLVVRAGFGKRPSPGFSRRLKWAIEERSAFEQSLQELLRWDFDQVIVGHGELLRQDAKRRVEALFRREKLIS